MNREVPPASMATGNPRAWIPVLRSYFRERVSKSSIHSDMGTYSGVWSLELGSDPWGLTPLGSLEVEPWAPTSSSTTSGSVCSPFAEGLRRFRPPRDPRRERLRFG